MLWTCVTYNIALHKVITRRLKWYRHVQVTQIVASADNIIIIGISKRAAHECYKTKRKITDRWFQNKHSKDRSIGNESSSETRIKLDNIEVVPYVTHGK